MTGASLMASGRVPRVMQTRRGGVGMRRVWREFLIYPIASGEGFLVGEKFVGWAVFLAEVALLHSRSNCSPIPNVFRPRAKSATKRYDLRENHFVLAVKEYNF